MLNLMKNQRNFFSPVKHQNMHRMASLYTREEKESNYDTTDVETNVSETSLIENVIHSEHEELRPDSPREIYQLRKWALDCDI